MNSRAPRFCRLVGCMLLALAFAVSGTAAAVPDDAPASERANDRAHQRTAGIDRGQQRGDRWLREEFLYVAAVNSGDDVNPDFLAVVGADPRDRESYGRIVARVDLPNLGDNVHHVGYSLDQERLFVPGLFSSRMHMLDVSADPRRPELVAVRDDLVEDSGYVAPHTVTPLEDGEVLVSMLGADTDTTGPGGIVVLDDETGAFVRYFGPGPQRTPDDLGPQYMYDLALNPEINRGISTTWGYPGDVLQSPYGPNGDEVAVWDLEQEQVIQTVSLGEGAGATESDWLHEHATRYGYTVAANGLWLWEDEDADGFFDFHHVLDDLAVPCDMVLTPNDRYVFIANWFTNTVQQYDITEVYQPRLVAEATVPHPCMMRLSPDAERLYVTNSVIATLDDDPAFGPRNDQYGIWQFDVHPTRPGLTSVTDEGGAWVDFSSVHKQHGVGPAGPHMILFDPGVPIAPGHH